MKKDEIQSKIESFGGNLNSAFLFICTIYQDLNIDFSNIYDTSAAESKFLTFTRNIINKKLISRPTKSGRALLLDGGNILEILVVKKYLNAGVTMKALVGHVSNMSPKELYARLFSDQLLDVADINNEYSSSQIPEDFYDNEPEQSDSNIFQLIEVNENMKLFIREGTYTSDKISTISKYLKRQK